MPIRDTATFIHQCGHHNPYDHICTQFVIGRRGNCPVRQLRGTYPYQALLDLALDYDNLVCLYEFFLLYSLANQILGNFFFLSSNNP